MDEETELNAENLNARDAEIKAIEEALRINLVPSAGPALAERVKVTWHGSLQLAKMAGDVGVGTGTSGIGGRLHVRKDIDGDAQLLVENRDGGTAARAVLRLGNSSTSGALSYTGDGQSSPNVLRLANASTGRIRLWTGNADRVTVDSDGKVGIGKAPGEKLDIDLPTEDLGVVDATSSGQITATEQVWIKVQIGTQTRYIRLYEST